MSDSKLKGSLITSGKDIKKDDLVILLLGPAGCGKSNMIDHLVLLPTPKANNTTLEASTKVDAVRVLGHSTYQNRLVLMDTPGLDGPDDVLQAINNWLDPKNLLTGILYLHPLGGNHAAPRMTSPPEANLARLRKYTTAGNGYVGNVYLIFTMCDKAPPSAEVKLDRKKEILSDYWVKMGGKGARNFDFDNKDETAQMILDNLLKTAGSTDLKGLDEKVKDEKAAVGFWNRLRLLFK